MITNLRVDLRFQLYWVPSSPRPCWCGWRRCSRGTRARCTGRCVDTTIFRLQRWLDSDWLPTSTLLHCTQTPELYSNIYASFNLIYNFDSIHTIRTMHCLICSCCVAAPLTPFVPEINDWEAKLGYVGICVSNFLWLIIHVCTRDHQLDCSRKISQ